MPTLAVGSDVAKPWRLTASGRIDAVRPSGFTLIELLLVLALMALVTSLVVLNLRDGPQQQLQQEAERLTAQLENARAQARTSHTPLLWRSDDKGFSVSPVADLAHPISTSNWLFPHTRSQPREWVISPEPVQAPMQLVLQQDQGSALRLQSDGVSAFKVQP